MPTLISPTVLCVHPQSSKFDGSRMPYATQQAVRTAVLEALWEDAATGSFWPVSDRRARVGNAPLLPLDFPVTGHSCPLLVHPVSLICRSEENATEQPGASQHTTLQI